MSENKENITNPEEEVVKNEAQEVKT